MENKNVIIGVVSLVLVVVLSLVIFSLFSSSDDDSQEDMLDVQEPADTDTDEINDRFSYIDRISAVHFYENGEHAFVGEIDMPTPCDLLETNVMVMESAPEQVVLEFIVINDDPDEMCAQVITPQRFRIDVSAMENASVRATFEGRDIELNLLEPQPGDTPDDFELYIKG